MAQDAATLDEPKRLDVLRSYEILDTLPEQAFDRRVRLAAQICGVPYAAITFMDGARQFVKSKVGFTDEDAPSFFSQATHHTDFFIMPDVTQDERLATDSLIIGAAQVQFYAGVPLMTTEGHVLGVRYKADEFLRSLVEGTVASTGRDFLRELVKHVATALGIRYAFVGYFLPESRIRTLAFWKGDGYLDQMEYSLNGTPCTKVSFPSNFVFHG